MGVDHTTTLVVEARMDSARLQQFVTERLFFVKIATVILWASWLVSLGMNGFAKDIKGDPIGTDHIAFYAAARLITEGQGTCMYDYEFLARYQQELALWEGGLDAYRNPPFYALVYVPTARVSYQWSFWIWSGVGVGLLILGLRILGPSNPWNYLLWSLSFYPVFAVVGFGQNSLLSFAIFSGVYWFLHKERYFFAGLVAGFLLFKPQLLLGLGVWGLLEIRRFRWALVGGAVTVAILVALSFLVVAEETREYIRRFGEIARYDQFAFWNLHSPRGFGTLIAGDHKAFGNAVALVCLVLAIVAFVMFWRRHRADLPLMFSAMMFLTLWGSPHTMIYEWTLVVIAAVLLWEHRPQMRALWMPFFAVVWVVMFVGTPLTKWQCKTFSPDGEHPGPALQISVPILAWIAWRVMSALRTKPAS